MEKTYKTIVRGALATGCGMWAPISLPVGHSETVSSAGKVAVKETLEERSVSSTVTETANAKRSERA